MGLDIWCYTGYTYEQLLQRAKPEELALLNACDVLIDGPFLQAERSLELRWRGSYQSAHHRSECHAPVWARGALGIQHNIWEEMNHVQQTAL